MLGRDAHSIGAPCRVDVEGGFVVTGGSEGSVALHTISHFPKSKPLWVMPKAHKGAVTAVVVSRIRNLVVSSARDGCIVVYRNAFPQTTTTPAAQQSQQQGVVSSLLCRVSGEINCLVLSQDGQRLFFGGDTVRCFSFVTKKVTTIPLPVPHPFCSIAVSPCFAPPSGSGEEDTRVYGEYIAMASITNRSIGVISVPLACYGVGDPPPSTDSLTIADPNRIVPTIPNVPAMPTKFVLEKLLPLDIAGGSTFSAFRMDWSIDAQRDDAVRLYIPTKEGVRVYEVQEELSGRLFMNPMDSTQPPDTASQPFGGGASQSAAPAVGRLSFIGTVTYNGLEGVVAVSAFRATKNKLELVCCVAGGSRVLNIRVDDTSIKKLTSTAGHTCHQAADIALLSTTNYVGAVVGEDGEVTGGGDPPSIMDFCIDRSTGTLCAVDNFGRLAIVKAFAAAQKKKNNPSSVGGGASQSQGGAAPITDTQPTSSSMLAIGGSTQAAVKKESSLTTPNTQAAEEDDTDAIQSSSGSNSSSSSSSDGDAESTDGEDNLDFDDGTNENLKVTAKDLIDNNPEYISDEDEVDRQVLTRRERAKRDVIAKQKEDAAKNNNRLSRENKPAFLDDEAEDGTSEEDSSDPLEEEERRLRKARGDEDDDGASSDEETALQHAYRVEERFRKRYNIDGSKSKKSRHSHPNEDNNTSAGDNDGHDGRSIGDELKAHALTTLSSPNRRGSTAMMGGVASTMVASPHMWWYSFQPGSTHFPSTTHRQQHNADAELDAEEEVGRVNTPAQNRFLAFNNVGALLHTPTHIYVLFHDMGRTTVRLIESRTCTMGALSTTGFALCFVHTVSVSGDPSTHEEAMSASSTTTTTTIMHRSFISMGLEPEWSVTLARGERVLNLAVGSRYVAVATSHGYIRIFSLSGIEMAVFSVPHHVVTLSGVNSQAAATVLRGGEKGSDPLLMVTMDNTMTHRIAIFDVVNDGEEMLKPTELPLTPPVGIYSNEYGTIQPTTLRWVGWGENGVVYTVDSIGVVRRLGRCTGQWGATSAAWQPVYDPRHLGAVHDRHWVWGITADETLLAYHSLAPPVSTMQDAEDIERGMLMMEPTASYDILPSTSRVRTCMPLLRSNGDENMIARDQYLRSYQRAVEAKKRSLQYTEELARIDQQLDEKLLQQFKNAVTATKTSRAVDIATMFQLSASLKTAATFANEKQARLVTEKCIALLEVRTKQKRHRACRLPIVGASEKAELLEKEKDRLLKDLLRKERDGTLSITGVANGQPLAAAAAATLTVTPQYIQQQQTQTQAVTQLQSEENSVVEVPTVVPTLTPRVVAAAPSPVRQLGSGSASSPPSVSGNKLKNPFAKSPATPSTVQQKSASPAKVVVITPPTSATGSAVKRERNERPDVGVERNSGSGCMVSSEGIVTSVSNGNVKRVVTFDDAQTREGSPERVGYQHDVIPPNLSPAKKQFRAEEDSPSSKRASITMPPPSPKKQSTLTNNMPSSPAKTTPAKNTSVAVLDAFKQQGVPTVKLTTSKAFSGGGGIALGGNTATVTPPGTSPIFQDLSQTQDSVMGFDPFQNTQQQRNIGVGGGANEDSSSAPPSESFAEALRRRYQEDEDDDDIPVVPVVTKFSMSMSAE